MTLTRERDEHLKTDYHSLVKYGSQLVKKSVMVWSKYGFQTMTRKAARRVSLMVSKPRVIRQPLFTEQELEQQRTHVFSREITFSIIVPLYNTPEHFLREMIESVQAQTYGKWELCLADGSTPDYAYVETICREYAKADGRIRYKKLEKNLGISGNTNACLELATGEYIALFDHDDLLHPAALHEMMKAICLEHADYVYTDEMIFVGNLKNVYAIHCKPEFSRDILLANNYICHFSAFSRAVLEQTGPFRSQYDGSQDHDFILRATEKAKKIVHIPKILYYWRSHPNSVASDISSKTYAIQAGINAVRDSLEAAGIPARVESSPVFPVIYRVRYPLTDRPPVSVILTGEPEEMPKCVKALEATAYKEFEILAVLPKSVQAPAELEGNPKVRLIRASEGEAVRNAGAANAKGEKLVFLSSRVTAVAPEWLEELLMYAQRSDIGVVGGKVYDENGLVYHSGLILDYGGKAVGDPFVGEDQDSDGFMGRLYYQSPQIAVSPDCMMVNRGAFLEVGGFDAAFEGNLAGGDLCLKLLQKGQKTFWAPYAVVTLQRPKRQRMDRQDKEAEAMFRGKWAEWFQKGDPYNSAQTRSLMEDHLGKHAQ